MITFPSGIRAPSYPFTPEWDRPVKESPFEDGSVQAYLKYTKGRDAYTVQWPSLPQNELDLLETFYKVTTKYGTLPFSFYWPSATGTKTITVQFADKPSTSLTTVDRWVVSIKIREV
jgi:hypothetical protein